jgi:hypothetical protein
VYTVNSFDVAIRVDGSGRLNVEWPIRLTDQSHQAARELILKIDGVDVVASTQYREIVHLAPHVTIADVAAQEVANVLLDDSGAFQRVWRGLGYDELNVSVLRW